VKISRQGPSSEDFVKLILSCLSNPKRRYFKSIIKFEPRDMWIGVFWDRKDIEYEYAKDFVRSSYRWRYDIFICPIPCLLFRFSVECGKPQWKLGNPAIFNRGRDETNTTLTPARAKEPPHDPPAT